MLPENPNIKLKFDKDKLKDIYLAGGCFWGTDAYMARVLGVYSTEVGYANGNTENPTYENVCHDNTGHAEVVYVKYDETKLSLTQLLKEYLKIINPTTLNKQGGDVGTQYRTGIYYTSENEEDIIKNVLLNEQKKYELPIVVEVLPLANYYPAEEYHQNYLEKNPNGYCHINF